MNKILTLLACLICYSVCADPYLSDNQSRCTDKYPWYDANDPTRIISCVDIDELEFIQFLASVSEPERILEISINDDPEDDPIQTLTDQSLQLIAEKCPFLKSFSTVGDRITDAGLKLLSAGCKELEELCLWVSLDCKGSVTDEGLIELAQNCPLLTLIDLTGHSAITDTAIESLANNCPNLEMFYVTGDDGKTPGQLTDQSLYLLAKHCKKLRFVEVSQNPGITYAGALALLESCESLDELAIERTSITKKEYKQLRKVRPKMDIDWSK